MFWNHPKPEPPTEIEKKILFSVKTMFDEGIFAVDREQLSKRIKAGPYQCFDFMASLNKKGYLTRNGWQFYLSDKGFKYLKEDNKFYDLVQHTFDPAH